MKNKNNNGFTIVELLVVIVVIGILAAITMVSYGNITIRAKEAVVQSELKNASDRLALYYAEHDSYPTVIDGSTKCPTAPIVDNKYCLSFGLDTTFAYSSNGSTFSLIATNGTVSKIITDNSSPSDYSAPTSFVKALGGASSEIGRSVIQASGGGYVVTGETNSYGAGSYDAFIAKYDLSSNLSWIKTWGGAGNDYGYSVAQLSDGGYAIAGITAQIGVSSNDVFVAKYDSSGNLSWSRTWGGTGTDYARTIVATSDGGFAVSGYTTSYGAGSQDMFLAKYASDGTLSWNKVWGGAAIDWEYSLIQTSDGGFAATGYTTSFGAGSNDMYLVKYDSSGNLSWNRTWGGASTDYGYSLVQTSDDGYMVTGQTSSYGAGGADAFIAKYDSSGTLSWSRTWGGTAADTGSFIALSSDSGYVFTGYSASFGAGNNDNILVKFDSSGTLSWNKTFGGAADDYSRSLFKTVDNGFVTTGSTLNYGAGNEDMLIAKYSSTGGVSGCSSPVCQSPTATVTSPTATANSPSATTSSPSASVSSPTVAGTAPVPTSTTIVSPQ